MVIVGFDLDFTAHPGTTVSTIMAVCIVRGSSTAEAVEDSVKDGLRAGILPWLETSVSNVVFVDEIELLGIEVSELVWGTRH
jgi:hypothetical protein